MIPKQLATVVCEQPEESLSTEIESESVKPCITTVGTSTHYHFANFFLLAETVQCQ